MCWNMSRRQASSYLKKVTLLEEQWNDLKEVCDGTRDRQEIEKTILGKVVNIFNRKR